jgi:hypothetical protein
MMRETNEANEANEASVQSVVMLLTRIAEALERAYPVPRNPEPPKQRKPKKPKFPVVMFSTVPKTVLRVWKSDVPDDQRCEAAVRPWVNGMQEPGKWGQCKREKGNGDCICKNHRTHAESTGIKTWQEVQST